MSGEDIAKAFVQHYYQTRDSNVDALANLFVSNSKTTKANKCVCVRALVSMLLLIVGVG